MYTNGEKMYSLVICLSPAKYISYSIKVLSKINTNTCFPFGIISNFQTEGWLKLIKLTINPETDAAPSANIGRIVTSIFSLL